MTLETVMIVLGLTLAAFVLNLPFGYMRTKTRKLSLMWFVYIHVPIPFIFLLRTLAGMGLNVIPVIVIGAVLGQLIGGRLNPARIS